MIRFFNEAESKRAGADIGDISPENDVFFGVQQELRTSRRGPPLPSPKSNRVSERRETEDTLFRGRREQGRV